MTTGHWYVRVISATSGLPDLYSYDMGAATNTLSQPTVTVCDINGDGLPNVIVGYNNKVQVLSHTLVDQWSWTTTTGHIVQDVIVSDLANDGRVQILATSFNPGTATPSSVPTTLTVLTPPTGGTTASIAADKYETNNTMGTAADLGTVQAVARISNLTIHQSSDIDYFKFHTAAVGTDANSVRIDFNRAAGALSLGLLDAAGRTVGSVSQGDEFVVISLAGLPVGDYFIAVAGSSGTTNPGYTLTVAGPTTAAVPKDQFETNDASGTATNLNPPDTAHAGQDSPLTGVKSLDHLSIHTATDADYFKFTLGATGLTGNYVQINTDSQQGDLNLALLDSAGSVLVTSPLSQVDQKTISLAGRVAGSGRREILHTLRARYRCGLLHGARGYWSKNPEAGRHFCAGCAK